MGRKQDVVKTVKKTSKLTKTPALKPKLKKVTGQTSSKTAASNVFASKSKSVSKSKTVLKLKGKKVVAAAAHKTPKSSNKSVPTKTSLKNNSTIVKKGLKPTSTASKASTGPSVRHKNEVTTTPRPPITAAKTVLDKSQTSFPYDIRINGLSSLLSTVQKATPKVKQLLLNECDLIMECRYCRNLFRSVPNFLSHKQTFCKSMFHNAADIGCSQFLQRPNNSAHEVNYQYCMDASALDFLPRPATQKLLANICDSSDSSLQISANQAINLEEKESRSSLSLYTDIQELNDSEKLNSEHSNPELTKTDQVNLVLEPITGRKDLVVYQTRVETDPSVCDSANNSYDAREVLDRDTAILGPDGKVICTGTARGIEKIVKHLTAQIDYAQRKMLQNSTNQFPEKCDICKTVFNTEKAFRQHRRDAPDCVKQSATKIGNGLQDSGSVRIQVNGGNFMSHGSPAKCTKLDESVVSTNRLVKQLFPMKSPSKKSPQRLTSLETSNSSIKAQYMTSPASKLSPYKKTIGKAVKNLHNTLGGLSRTPIPGIKSELPFYCVKCPSRFRTSQERNLHLASNCTARATSSSSTTTDRIGIEVRNTYSKTETSISAIPDSQKRKTGSTSNDHATHASNYSGGTSTSTSPAAAEELKAICNPNLHSSQNSTVSSTKILESVVKRSVDVDTSTSMVASELPPEFSNMTASNNHEQQSDEGKINVEVSNVSIDHLDPKDENDDYDNSLQTLLEGEKSTCESEPDQETISNVTDSGVSTATGTSEDNLDTHPDIPVLSTDVQIQLQLPSSSIDKDKGGTGSRTRPKRKSKAEEDRILTPKNKNLKMSNIVVQKRVSVRNMQKASRKANAK